MNDFSIAVERTAMEKHSAPLFKRHGKTKPNELHRDMARNPELQWPKA
jgi:hypothetical protein